MAIKPRGISALVGLSGRGPKVKPSMAPTRSQIVAERERKRIAEDKANRAAHDRAMASPGGKYGQS